MQENKDTAIDALLTKTPFHLPEGCELVIENRNSSCSHAEIETLIQKRILNRTDLEIMKTVAVFPLLNHHNLRYALSLALEEELKKESYADNLKKMKDAGILLCYRLERTSDADAHGPKDAALPVSPLRLYALSQSAYSYMEKIIPDANPAVSTATVPMLRMASASQFVLRFCTAYRDKVHSFRLRKTIKNGRCASVLDAVIQFFPPGGKTDEKSLASIILLSVREHEKWVEEETFRLKTLAQWLSRQAGDCPSPVIIFCVEQIFMALLLHASVQAIPLLSIWEKYYCPDSLLTAYPPLKALYRCENKEDGVAQAVRLDS